MKEIRKTEKEKEEEKRKYETGPRGTLSAQKRIQPAAQEGKTRTGTALSLPLADKWAPVASLLPPPFGDHAGDRFPPRAVTPSLC
jgi:hypothetical protein